jgi:hypothetical protein
VRITRESGSDSLILPSGSSGATNGLLLPFSTRPFVSRAVARESFVDRNRGKVDPVVLLKPFKRADHSVISE